MNRASVLLAGLIAGCGAPAVVVPAPPPAARVVVSEASVRDDDAARARELLGGLAAATPAEGVRTQHELMRLGAAAWPVFDDTLRDPDAGSSARQAAALALGEADDQRACAALDAAWLSPAGDERVRVAHAVALGRCGTYAPLRALCGGAQEIGVRLKAAIALGLLSVADARADVAQLRDESPAELLDFATLALALLGDHDAADRVALATPDLSEVAPDVAGFFALALYRGGIARDDVPAALRDAALQSPDPLLREQALRVLATERDRWAPTALTTATSDPSRRVAGVASQLLDDVSGGPR